VEGGLPLREHATLEISLGLEKEAKGRALDLRPLESGDLAGRSSEERGQQSGEEKSSSHGRAFHVGMEFFQGAILSL